jgi:predicted nucleic acid-binding protein
MTRAAIVDTGPLVAALDRRDAAHGWVGEQLKALAPPLLVCEPVLTEVAYLLGRRPGQTDVLLGLVSSGALRVAWSLDAEVEAVRGLMRKYADQPMSLADACVVRMAEVFDDHAVFTLDTDFAVYRTSRNLPIRLIAP